MGVNDLACFSFPLNPRMLAFVQLRDGLRCLMQAEADDQPLAWLAAAADVRASLLGEMGRKPALAEVCGLLTAMQTYLRQLLAEHPHYREVIEAALLEVEQHRSVVQQDLSPAIRMLGNDALVCSYCNALKKQDWLGHQRSLPQGLPVLWQRYAARAHELGDALRPLAAAVFALDERLHDHVPWQQRTAKGGSDQIVPGRDKDYGLLIIGLDREAVAGGLLPHISGNRLAVRLRFQYWPPGEAAEPAAEDIAYNMMLVPIG